jgi:hypothetical protein
MLMVGRDVSRRVQLAFKREKEEVVFVRNWSLETSIWKARKYAHVQWPTIPSLPSPPHSHHPTLPSPPHAHSLPRGILTRSLPPT